MCPAAEEEQHAMRNLINIVTVFTNYRKREDQDRKTGIGKGSLFLQSQGHCPGFCVEFP